MEFLLVCLNNLKESKNKLLVLSLPNITAGHVNLLTAQGWTYPAMIFVLEH